MACFTPKRYDWTREEKTVGRKGKGERAKDPESRGISENITEQEIGNFIKCGQ